MKKFFTSLAFVICLANLANAQIKLGLKCSPQITWIGEKSRDVNTSGAKLNASYGLMIDKFFNENYAIGTEIAITSMTTKMHTVGSVLKRPNYADQLEPSYNYRLQYIAVPLILKMRTNEIGYFRYYAEFGMNFGFLFRAKADIEKNGSSLNNVNINNPEDDYTLTNQTSGKTYDDQVRFFRSALLVGAGIQYNMFSNSLLVVGARYENSFSDFTKEKDWKATMNMAGLHIGVLF
jgi:opacity protein-like surface antigen